MRATRIRVHLWKALEGMILTEDTMSIRETKSRPSDEYYHDHILAALIPLRSEAGGRKLVLYVSNARTHMVQKCQAFSAKNGLRLATHTPYSPDLALSDFFLFGMSRIVCRELYFHHTENYV
jgi:hypothetical protein